jgi:hypothetical protein
MVCGNPVYNVYFKGKLVKSKGVVVVTDRPGSVRRNANGETFSYYPYGEERTSTADNREKFATYMRDNPVQDYADQRYYGPRDGEIFHARSERAKIGESAESFELEHVFVRAGRAQSD